jgi:acetoin:2,6-dichlorophenolindophenol oxidoreductase subunit alpha
MTDTTSTTDALRVTAYRHMTLVRQFEQEAYRAYERGELVGSIHACLGQEAVAAGVVGALEPSDLVLSHHRAHGHALVKGVDPGRLMAELLGRASGVSGGKGGSMHLTDTSCGFLGSYSIVASSVPLSVGVALAQKIRRSGAVVVVFFGDGAINQGVLYESMNLAMLWRLPLLFACENNRFAISVRTEDATAGPGLVARAESFGLAARGVDGQDVVEVDEAVRELLRGVRAGDGPALLECATYRFMGHSRGDPPYGLYRTQEEVATAQERDPLVLAGLSDDERARYDAEAAERVARALEFARAADPPELEAAMTEVWG